MDWKGAPAKRARNQPTFSRVGDKEIRTSIKSLPRPVSGTDHVRLRQNVFIAQEMSCDRTVETTMSYRNMVCEFEDGMRISPQSIIFIVGTFVIIFRNYQKELESNQIQNTSISILGKVGKMHCASHPSSKAAKP